MSLPPFCFLFLSLPVSSPPSSVLCLTNVLLVFRVVVWDRSFLLVIAFLDFPLVSLLLGTPSVPCCPIPILLAFHPCDTSPLFTLLHPFYPALVGTNYIQLSMSVLTLLRWYRLLVNPLERARLTTLTCGDCTGYFPKYLGGGGHWVTARRNSALL